MCVAVTRLVAVPVRVPVAAVAMPVAVGIMMPVPVAVAGRMPVPVAVAGRMPVAVTVAVVGNKFGNIQINSE